MSTQLKDEISSIKNKAIAEIESVASLQNLEKLRLLYLGKKGVIRSYFDNLKKVEDAENKRSLGAVINDLHDSLSDLIRHRENVLKAEEINAKLQNEAVDVTLPPRPEKVGKIHPLSQVIREVKLIFAHMGFAAVDGPDIEDEFHVFDALNTPSHHPAREEQDTFYLKNKINNQRMLLRTHTSSVQIRVMEKTKSFPIKIVAPGRVYRNDFDATHTPMFHQIEGLYVNENVNMGQLKFTIHHFLNKFFGEKELKIRFRNSFFPFTEPSAEVDISYKGSKWIEVLGCGMVHPNVFQNVGVDHTKYKGFAFGIGIERLAMLKYQIDDLRSFYDNKINWLDHYGFHFSS
ncbi:MAG TPA: phenylalanine--tRNA ligase subunit alpha [Wolbachia sp.]|jgi:phenylalanyl-tRNA synthetase alpha chain|uniref:phenylalanine--tRNA ligase subunit alpha n=1 Tax=Wolbachia endosymbiont of Pentalonia nigronervosa TaxID=1301914 RepID=UPI000EDE7314|nr:phenylalanine--tRNA ligase subunit alpha [Wolbachia endosymbiont of Pentalonia nigronervosa]MBD0391621.1 phenylalanine--tRNA ligase subunit alpha [Wolbachia endosymbiont of Pentalonia nigronervosa]HCE59348.1 phenylalanine--tRNA ligase subunit alpha [Wolbachia sp.]